MRIAIPRLVADRTLSRTRSLAVAPALVTAAAVAALTALGAVFRLTLLGGRSVWLDEAFSIFIGRLPMAETLRQVIETDAHPPLYYLALNLWMAGGSDEAHVRLLSALFSIACIPLMYLVAASLYQDRRAGWIAAAVLAFSPFHIRYAQEARMYSMLVFFILLSAFCFVVAIRQRSGVAWGGFAAATTLALYTDYGAMWYAAALALFYLLSFRRLRGGWAGWTLSHAAIGVLYLPWFPTLLRQTRRVAESFWLPAPTFHAVLGAFQDFHSLNFPWLEATALYGAAMLVLAYAVPERQGWERRLFTFWLFAPVAISALLSLRQPIFLSRNLIAASLGYYLLVTGVIWRFRSGRATAFLLLPLLAMNLVSQARTAGIQDGEDWRAAAAFVAEDAANIPERFLVFVPGYAELPFDYYFDRYAMLHESQGYPRNELLLHPDAQQRVSDPVALLEGRPFVWLVMRDAERVDPEPLVKRWLDTNGYYRMGDVELEKLTVIAYFHWESVAPWSPHPEDGFLVEFCRSQESRRSLACPPPRGAPSNVRYHRVNPGETLSWIALRYGSTLEAMVKANGLVNPNRIRVGQELIIPVFEEDPP